MDSEVSLSLALNPSVKNLNAYHHGNLRAALIAAAGEALETKAPESVSLKALAAQLGVSQKAPYKHFDNREALLAAVAIEGLQQFRVELTSAAAEVAEHKKLERSCQAYLHFAETRPGLYRLMFASHLLKTAHDPSLDHAATAAFEGLLKQVAKYVAPNQVNTTAILVWSTLHGLAMLEAEGLTSGPLQQQVNPAEVVSQMISAIAFQQAVLAPGGADAASTPVRTTRC